MKSFRYIVLLLFASVCSIHWMVAGDDVRDTLEISKGFQARPASLLEGKTSGVHVFSTDGSVNGDIMVYVRGLNSVRSDSQPLWVVDGMPLVSAFNLNPYDIESIEVIKDISATAIYGFKGANGVILVKTKRHSKEGLNVEWHSNASVSIPVSDEEAGRVALSHNQSLSVASVNGQSQFNLSGYWRTENDVIKGNGGNSGLVNVLYETRANPVVWFSTNTMLNVGGTSTTTGDFLPGEPLFLQDDYDNDCQTWRAFNTTSLALNLSGNLSFNLNIGVDYLNNTSYVWFGNGTARGAAVNGEACISGASLLRYSARPVLSWYRFFGEGRLDVSAGASIDGDYNRINVMRGTDFFSHELRSRGLNIHASKSVIDNHAINYFSHGFFAKAAFSYGDYAGMDALIRTDRTQDYDDSPVLHYAMNVYFNPIGNVKVCAGFGMGGYEQLADYDSFARFVSGPYPVVNPELTYYYKGLNRVKSREWNLGVETPLLNRRLNVAAKFFSKHSDDAFNAYCFGRKTTDTYLWRYSKRTDYFATSSGFATSGVELDADAKIIDTDRRKWSAGFNLSWLTTKITDVGELDSAGLNAGTFGDALPGLLAGINTSMMIERFSLQAEFNAAALYNADFIKLGRFGVAYDMHRIRFSLSGHNLLLLGSVKGVYPGPFPYARSVIAGIRITF